MTRCGHTILDCKTRCDHIKDSRRPRYCGSMSKMLDSDLKNNKSTFIAATTVEHPYYHHGLLVTATTGAVMPTTTQHCKTQWHCDLPALTYLPDNS